MGLAYYQSPLGLIAITGNDVCVTKIQFVNDPLVEATENPGKEVKKCLQELDEYFNKRRQHFTVIISLEGSAFRKTIWCLLQAIEYGKTISYVELAKRYGDINTVRAVGKANSMNPIAIVVPCHRVLGVKGDLIGYAGGLDKKRWLLEHENASLPNGQMNLF